jgi:SAM-dependent methyltransferase
MEKIKEMVPWWGKIAAKIMLSRLHLDYNRFWKRLGMFVNGPMEDTEYAIGVFERHYRDFAKKPFVCMELGCGDSLATALIAKLHGATSTYLVDVGDFANRSINTYKRLASMLDMDVSIYSMESYMEACNASYLTKGLLSLKSVPDNSIDFIFSQAVLEHVRKREFRQTLVELRRILKSGGKMSHAVDLKDHLGGGLNNLRFSQYLWEKDWVACSGFYTNRLHYFEMVQLFEDAGFDCETTSIIRFKKMPLERHKMAPAFRRFSDDDLLISGFNVVLS